MIAAWLPHNNLQIQEQMETVQRKAAFLLRGLIENPEEVEPLSMRLETLLE